VNGELGWADFQVRSTTAIRRHQTLMNCTFSFCVTPRNGSSAHSSRSAQSMIGGTRFDQPA
jgi:hypothetical protein